MNVLPKGLLLQDWVFRMGVNANPSHKFVSRIRHKNFFFSIYRKMRSNHEMDCSRAGLENCLAVAEAAAEAEATNGDPDLNMTKKNNYMMLRYDTN